MLGRHLFEVLPDFGATVFINLPVFFRQDATRRLKLAPTWQIAETPPLHNP